MAYICGVSEFCDIFIELKTMGLSHKSGEQPHFLFYVFNYSSSSLEVQCAQRVASIEISLLQNGQTFVVGAAGSSSTFFLPNDIRVFIPLISKKRTKAIIMKLITAEMKADR